MKLFPQIKHPKQNRKKESKQRKKIKAQAIERAQAQAIEDERIRIMAQALEKERERVLRKRAAEIKERFEGRFNATKKKLENRANAIEAFETKLKTNIIKGAKRIALQNIKKMHNSDELEARWKDWAVRQDEMLHEQEGWDTGPDVPKLHTSADEATQQFYENVSENLAIQRNMLYKVLPGMRFDDTFSQIVRNDLEKDNTEPDEAFDAIVRWAEEQDDLGNDNTKKAIQDKLDAFYKEYKQFCLLKPRIIDVQRAAWFTKMLGKMTALEFLIKQRYTTLQILKTAVNDYIKLLNAPYGYLEIPAFIITMGPQGGLRAEYPLLTA